MKSLYRHNIECDTDYFLTHEELNQGRSESQIKRDNKAGVILLSLIIGNILIITAIYWIAKTYCK